MENLDLWETANVRADFLAKQYLQEYGRTSQGVIPSIGKKDMWTVYYDNDMIVSNISKRLYSSIWAHHSRHFWLRKLRVPEVFESLSQQGSQTTNDSDKLRLWLILPQ